MQLVEIDRTPDANYTHLTQPPGDEGIAQLCPGRTGDQDWNAEVLGRSLDPAGQVDRVTEGTIHEFPTAARVADLGRPRVDADANREWMANHGLPHGVQRRQLLEHC